MNWARRNTCNMCNQPKFGKVEQRTGRLSDINISTSKISNTHLIAVLLNTFPFILG